MLNKLIRAGLAACIVALTTGQPKRPLLSIFLIQSEIPDYYYSYIRTLIVLISYFSGKSSRTCVPFHTVTEY
jgi:hypothetical protein